MRYANFKPIQEPNRAGRWAAYIAFIILTLVFLGGYQAGVWG